MVHVIKENGKNYRLEVQRGRFYLKDFADAERTGLNEVYPLETLPEFREELRARGEQQ